LIHVRVASDLNTLGAVRFPLYSGSVDFFNNHFRIRGFPSFLYILCLKPFECIAMSMGWKKMILALNAGLFPLFFKEKLLIGFFVTTEA